MRDGDPNLVRIWSAELSDATVSDRILSLDEKDGAERLFFASYRSRFIAGCLFLSRGLTNYLAFDPASSSFACKAMGIEARGTHRVVPDFNFAHAERFALGVVSWTSPVGVDLEMI